MKTPGQVAFEAFDTALAQPIVETWEKAPARARAAWEAAALAVMPVADRPGESVKDVALDIMRSNDKPLAPGDVVQLKSGGPVMTLSHKAGDDDSEGRADAWWCTWFDVPTPASYSTPSHHGGVFSLACLRRADPPGTPSAPSSGPDAWDWNTMGEGEPGYDPPDGYTWSGPWEPRNAVWTGEATLVLMRRPLRKVAP